MNGWERLPPLSSETIERLHLYALRIREAPFNLTAVKDETGIVLRHFADSLALLPLLPAGRHDLLDVGTGGGFPGLVLKLARPDLEVTLLDATRKKLTFLENLSAELGVRVTTVHGRGEELSRKPEFAGRFDVVTARAVAALPELCKLCLPFLKADGLFLAMKGSQWRKEWESAQDTPSKYGARWLTPHPYTLPLPDGDAHYAVCVAQKS